MALILASPLALGRRVQLALYAVAALVGLHAAGTATVIVLGWTARPLVAPFQIVNDFLSLAGGPGLWLLLTRPSRAWFSPPTGEAPRDVTRARAEARRGGPAARPAR